MSAPMEQGENGVPVVYLHAGCATGQPCKRETMNYRGGGTWMYLGLSPLLASFMNDLGDAVDLVHL